MSIATRNRQGLPEGLHRVLARLDARFRRRDFAVGLGRLVLAASVGLLVGMAVDFVVPLPAVVRWACWIVWVGVGVMAARSVVWALVRRTPWSGLAAILERNDPTIEERVSCAVGLMSGEDGNRGSEELIGEVVSQAEGRVTEAATGSCGRDSRRMGWWLLGGVTSMAAVTIPMVCRPDPFAVLARRMAAPWMETAPVARFALEVEPGNVARLVGDDVAFRVRVRPRFVFGAAVPERAVLVWSDRLGEAHTLPLSASEATEPNLRVFSGELRGLTTSVRYRAEAAGVSSSSFTVTALEPPGATQVSVKVTAPGYTRFPARTLSNPPGLRVFENSAVEFTIQANREMRAVSLDWPMFAEKQEGPGSQRRPLSRGERGWSIALPATAPGVYTILFEDEHGLMNHPDARPLQVVRDMPPELALDGSDEPREARPDDRLSVDFAARDDVGVAGAELVYRIERGGGSDDPRADREEGGRVPVVLEGVDTRVATGQAFLSLNALNLHPGDEVEYVVEVRDHRPKPGPNVTRSPARRLRIRENAQALALGGGESEREALRAELERLRKQAEEDQQRSQMLRYAADSALRGNGAWGPEQRAALGQLVENARDRMERLEKLARGFEESLEYAGLAPVAESIGTVESDGVREIVERAADAKETRQRLADLRLADSRLGGVRARLDDLKRQFDEESKRADDRAQLRSLAEREEELARRAAQAAEAGDRAELEALRREQEGLRQQVDDLVRQSPELRAELMRQQMKQAEALARETRALAERQREEERATSDPASRQGRMSALAEAQQSLANDARKLALEVDAALQENGRGRVNSDTVARPAEALNRGDTSAAVPRIEESGHELHRLVRELEEVRSDPKVRARRLARRQEELGQEVAALIQQADTDPERATLGERLKPFARRQAELAEQAKRLTQSIADHEGQRNGVSHAMNEAMAALADKPAEAARPRQSEARDALNRLADALPEAWQVRQQVQQRLQQTREQMDSIARELERHLRETDELATQRKDPVAGARELAQRVGPLVERQREALKTLDGAQPTASAAPQLERARQSARDLLGSIEALRKRVPPESDGRSASVPLSEWRLLGPFAFQADPPFDVDRAIDFKVSHKDAQDRLSGWKLARAGEQGVVDLHDHYGNGADTANASAFGVSEFVMEAGGPARLSLGSDDSLLVWLNGRRVFDFPGNRSFAPGQDTVNVTLVAGANRIVVRCGNGQQDWKFAATLTPPPSAAAAQRLARFDEAKRALRARVADTRAGMDRLSQAVQDRDPADRRARQLADLARDAEVPKAPPDEDFANQPDLKRVEAGVRALDVPDAALYQAQALEALKQALAKPSEATLQKARQATERLAQRLEGTLADAEAARALADMQRTADPAASPRHEGSASKARDELARLADSEAKANVDAALSALEARERSASREKQDAATTRETAHTRQAAAESLDRLADALEPNAKTSVPPGAKQAIPEPDLAPEPELGLARAHQAEAARLKERQQEIAEAVRSVLAERAGPQGQIRDDAQTLADAFAQLRDEVRDISQSGAQGAAQAAADSLQHQAMPAMERGQRELAQGQAQAARDAQRQAADAIEQAARQAADLANALRTESGQLGGPEAVDNQTAQNGGEAGADSEGNLQSARAAQAKAAGSLSRAAEGDAATSREGAASASQAMKEAADGLRSASAGRNARKRSLAKNQAKQGAPQSSDRDPSGEPGGAVDPYLGALDPSGLAASRRLWGQLPGEMREEIRQLSQGRYRSEYARLIQLYYRELAGEPAGDTPPEPEAQRP